MFTTLSHESLATTRGGQLDTSQKANVAAHTVNGAIGGGGVGAFFGTVLALANRKVRRPGAVIGYTALAGAAIWGAVAGWNDYDWEKGGW